MKYRIERDDRGNWFIADVWKRGHAILSDPLLNKGTAFSPEEREIFELDGMLPYRSTDRAHQVQRAYAHVEDQDTELEKYVSLTSLMNRNETLFYQVLASRVEELLPIVYTPTVGHAAVRYSRLFRRGRGLWITPDHKGRIFEVLGHARNEEVKLIVVTDNERILGLSGSWRSTHSAPVFILPTLFQSASTSAPTTKSCSPMSSMRVGDTRGFGVRSTTSWSTSSSTPSSAVGRRLSCSGKTSRRPTRSLCSTGIGSPSRRSTTTSKEPPA